ncbi:Beta-lactamase hydrolase-like protein [Zhongshania aliphaticivorans]|uniref:Beta-lactamase hydrolase-like protein n=1 Tax=Zhongshania aliphaticivorans TaxID=1470434 RepID=A0A5S9PJL8_9GAMM|nr:bifunctional protein tyrosine phosphatase family protein/NAD(P)/FAD-dependent oxidoreductase [Zhongshania aliphaticivorans]CAA0104229.1 Beta-lactamase hydrolase-like protein [Zhongshania aliphaticivorans]CAA0104408.1 Beta-lactamase hydrolase-like protein [Zhongshania aliphaticivorans]
MNIKDLSPNLTVSEQLLVSDVSELEKRGVRTIICNRPEGEGVDQTPFADIQNAAKEHDIECHYLPVIAGKVRDEEAAAFGELLKTANYSVHAYCRSGMRSTTLWALSQAGQQPLANIVASAKAAGYDMSGVATRIAGTSGEIHKLDCYDVVIVGGGAAGISTASSLLARDNSLSIAIIEPAEKHYYQPGWTMVGAGVFTPQQTKREMSALIPKGAKWIKAAAAAFDPEKNTVVLEGCLLIKYARLVVAPGIKLNWEGIEGLSETLGKNGVTSNYHYDLAPYTWELVQNLQGGRALFTQPPMPIKCAGAPQKAMYLSSDYWFKNDCIDNIDIEFYNAGAVLFGVADYLPALEQYVAKYKASLNFNHKLVKIDGDKKTAYFEITNTEGQPEIISREFDMIHVCPPQVAPDFIRSSPLVDDAGWVDVDPNTLRHKRFANIWSLGDVANSPNAKTMAAVRVQAPIVATNILADIKGEQHLAHYNGYGSCPLTVERGKIVLAEFGYGGKLLPSLPKWLINGTKPSRAAWFLKEKMLPFIYWQGMLKGKEWLVSPKVSNDS